MFSEELNNYSWEEITQKIYAKSTEEVARALAKEHLQIDDFMALISPAADRYLEEMAARSRMYTQQRFGKTISMYIPLYITNSCTNFCVYCGFNHNNPITRIILSEEEIAEECKAIRRLGPFENLLIVTGENPHAAGVDYIERALQIARPYFSNLTIEVMPLKSEEYSRLTHVGLNGVVCFQETYHRERYKVYHPKGMKSNFEWRVNGFDRMGQAGVHKIGLGVLIGLEEWRTDITFMAIHLQYLRKKYWKTRYSVNFPRLRPSKGNFQPNVIMSDRQLAQTIFAFRLFDHDVDISISTRENPRFRDHILTLGATSLSAGSKTEPGGYFTHPQALEQFTVSDDRTPNEVETAIKKAGYETVWKDWDRIFD
ncbi:MAG: 2-iminoacetate synthase ThiH [Porphyromonadaceae bacterium]|nr:2-iminoacetate synthase ThiH [Porphyromonadaceae bacterium]